MYQVEVSRHARRRMAQRRVDIKEVWAVIDGPPDVAVHDPDEKSYRLELTLPGGRLKVWVSEPWPPGYAVATVHVRSVAWKDR